MARQFNILRSSNTDIYVFSVSGEFRLQRMGIHRKYRNNIDSCLIFKVCTRINYVFNFPCGLVVRARVSIYYGIISRCRLRRRFCSSSRSLVDHQLRCPPRDPRPTRPFFSLFHHRLRILCLFGNTAFEPWLLKNPMQKNKCCLIT